MVQLRPLLLPGIAICSITGEIARQAGKSGFTIPMRACCRMKDILFRKGCAAYLVLGVLNRRTDLVDE